MRHRWFQWWVLLTIPLIPGPFVVGGMMFAEAYSDSFEKVWGILPLFVFSLILSYTSLAYLVNSSTVRLEEELLTVRHGPLPWKGSAFRLSDCEQFEAGRLEEFGNGAPCVRVRFADDSSELLVHTGSERLATDWAAELNSWKGRSASNEGFL